MNAEVQEKAKNNVDDDAFADTGNVTDDGDKSPTTALDDAHGGHLQNRAAQFSERTDEMKTDWYLTYANLRRGSFLPRRTKGEMEDWVRKRREKGESVAGQWSHMSAVSVRFLHWTGFSPNSRLPPPDDETTQLLAFLGYDFFGRIVEKAILLGKTAAETTKINDDIAASSSRGVELDDGEQLTVEDIALSMKEADVKPVSIFSAESNKKNGGGVGMQLYFGPGFEDRLELELEEALAEPACIEKEAQEDQQKRAADDELFSSLEKAPTIRDMQFILGDPPATTPASNTAEDIQQRKKS